MYGKTADNIQKAFEERLKKNKTTDVASPIQGLPQKHILERDKKEIEEGKKAKAHSRILNKITGTPKSIAGESKSPIRGLPLN